MSILNHREKLWISVCLNAMRTQYFQFMSNYFIHWNMR